MRMLFSWAGMYVQCSACSRGTRSDSRVRGKRHGYGHFSFRQCSVSVSGSRMLMLMADVVVDDDDVFLVRSKRLRFFFWASLLHCCCLVFFVSIPDISISWPTAMIPRCLVLDSNAAADADAAAYGM